MLISIVGNAKSIFTKKDGNIIDSADMVIRFNGGVIIRPESQGTKTTVLVYSIYVENLNDFGNVEYWQTENSERFNLERDKIKRELDINLPSNGIITLEKLKNDYPSANVQIFGFDWKETPSWYNNDTCQRKEHDYTKEKEYCLRLFKEEKWILY